jgi:hypothetical protein
MILNMRNLSSTKRCLKHNDSKIQLRRPSQLLPSFKPPDQTMNQPTEVSIADELSKLAKLAFLPYSSFPSIIGLTGTCSFLTFSLENISADVDVSGSSSFISIPISFLIASFPSLAPISIIWAF